MSGDGWRTPAPLAKMLGRFDLDPCSNKRSRIRARITCALDGSGDHRDGLALKWRRGWSVFANWPFSRPLPWARKIAAHEGPWVVLCKYDPSTRWFAALMEASPTVAPFRKRIRFEGDATGSAKFPCALVYSAWRPSRELAAHLWLPTFATGGAPA